MDDLTKKFREKVGSRVRPSKGAEKGKGKGSFTKNS